MKYKSACWGRVALLAIVLSSVAQPVAAQDSGRAALLAARGHMEAGQEHYAAARYEAAAQELSDLPGQVLPLACHVGKPDQLEDVVRETEARFGPIDVLVNNSATNIGQGPALQATGEMLDKMVEVNVKSCLRLVNLIVPKMIERNAAGSIINIASIAGLEPQPGGLLYSFTKAGLLMMTRSWAREFGPHGIRVNAIAPGLTDTAQPRYGNTDAELIEMARSTIPLGGRLLTPDQIARTAVFLASEESSATTGQVLHVNGGSYMS